RAKARGSSRLRTSDAEPLAREPASFCDLRVVARARREVRDLEVDPVVRARARADDDVAELHVDRRDARVDDALEEIGDRGAMSLAERGVCGDLTLLARDLGEAAVAGAVRVEDRRACLGDLLLQRLPVDVVDVERVRGEIDVPQARHALDVTEPDE